MGQGGLVMVGCGHGVGTTTVVAALGCAFQARGLRIGVFKPVETGCALAKDLEQPVEVDGMPGELDAASQKAYARLNELVGAPPPQVSAKTKAEVLEPRDARLLTELLAKETDVARVNPFRFSADVAPGLAAEMAQRPMALAQLLAGAAELAEGQDALLVDCGGAPGEPLDRETTQFDLIRELGWPVMLVGTTERSSVSPLVLLHRYLSTLGVTQAGVVLNRRERRPQPREAATPHAIEWVLGDVIRGVLPPLESSMHEPETLARRAEVHIDLDSIVRVMREAT